MASTSGATAQGECAQQVGQCGGCSGRTADVCAMEQHGGGRGPQQAPHDAEMSLDLVHKQGRLLMHSNRVGVSASMAGETETAVTYTWCCDATQPQE